MATTNTAGKSAPKKKAAKKTAAKSVVKKAAAKPAAKPSKPTTPKSAAKRNRESKPLYATVTLGKLKDLLGESNDDAEVVVSRNFVLDIKKKQLEEQAEKDLGI